MTIAWVCIIITDILLPACAAVLLFPSFRSRARFLLATLAAATVCYLTWLNVIRLQTDSPGLEWVSTFFHGLPPTAAILRSLEVLGAGGKYPPMNYELSFFQTFRWFAVTVYVSVFAGFAVKGSRVKIRTDAWTRNGHARMLLIVFLFTPLALAWVIFFIF